MHLSIEIVSSSALLVVHGGGAWAVSCNLLRARNSVVGAVIYSPGRRLFGLHALVLFGWGKEDAFCLFYWCFGLDFEGKLMTVAEKRYSYVVVARSISLPPLSGGSASVFFFW